MSNREPTTDKLEIVSRLTKAVSHQLSAISRYEVSGTSAIHPSPLPIYRSPHLSRLIGCQLPAISGTLNYKFSNAKLFTLHLSPALPPLLPPYCRVYL